MAVHVPLGHEAILEASLLMRVRKIPYTVSIIRPRCRLILLLLDMDMRHSSRLTIVINGLP